MIAFISGHLDLTQEEFDEHYKRKILTARILNYSFVVGDARGCDTMAQLMLSIDHNHNSTHLPNPDVTVYHMFDSPRYNWGFKTVGGFTSDKERDEAMTAVSDYDIAWVREGRKTSGTAQNIKRRVKNGGKGFLSETAQLITKPLSEYHTKELLAFRRGLESDWSDYNAYIKYGEWDYWKSPSKPNYTVDELKTELAKRPHIPNKKEGKELRREAAKRKT